MITDVAVDQPFWGWRLEQLGAGVRLPFRKITAERLGAALDKALSGSAAPAAAFGARIAAENVNAAVDIVERWAEQGRSGRGI